MARPAEKSAPVEHQSGSSASSAGSSSVPSTATSATSPESRSCPPLSLSGLSISSAMSNSPPSRQQASSGLGQSTADITSPVGTRPTAQPLPAPAPLSVSTWNSLANSSVPPKTGIVQRNDNLSGHGDRRGSAEVIASVLVRRLPAGMTHEALRCILLFTSDLIDVQFVGNPDELGYQSAVAHFASIAGATDACHQLNGKILNHDCGLIVELLPQPGLSAAGSCTSLAGLGSIGAGRHSRFFNSNGVAVATNNVGGSMGVSASGSGSAIVAPVSALAGSTWLLNSAGPLGHPMSQPCSAIEPPTSSLFSPSAPSEPSNRFSDMINQAGVVGPFGGFPTSLSAIPREDKTAVKAGSLSQARQSGLVTDPITIRSLQASVSGLSSPPPSAAAGARGLMGHPTTLIMPPTVIAQATAPASANTPATGTASMWFNTSQQQQQQQQPTPTVAQFSRHNLPPINPADQNPPCNTLYVGNLPLDTSEDELKAMFSKQRGFKRLCFRVKHNGPMCFVEFEDVSFATKALNDLYGYPLHNSVKGGIRLSFSKNPLGVRSGQNPANGLGTGMHTRLSTVSGPPPGLPTPSFYPHSAGPKNVNNPGCNTAANVCFPLSADISTHSFENAPWNQPVGYTAQFQARTMGR